MSSMKCLTCGIGFFSPDGKEKCSKCRTNEPQSSEGHDGCGCGHSHN